MCTGRAVGRPRYRTVQSILVTGLEQLPLDDPAAPRPVIPLHSNLRGAAYYAERRPPPWRRPLNPAKWPAEAHRRVWVTSSNASERLYGLALRAGPRSLGLRPSHAAHGPPGGAAATPWRR